MNLNFLINIACAAGAGLSNFAIQYAHALSVIKRYNELKEITCGLKECLALAGADFSVEKDCLETVFNSDYFWL